MYPYGKSYPAAATYSANDDYRYGFNGMEKEKSFDSEGDVADFGARFLDTEYPIFGSPDPLEKEYPSQSTFSFVLNNPINAIDPDGRDVILLIDKEGAGGRGHMGMLFQDEKGSWYYFSQGATGNPSKSDVIMSQNITGGVQLNKLIVTETVELKDNSGNPIFDKNGKPKTKQITRDATEKEALASAKNGTFGTKYDASFKINTSSDEDKKIHKGATKVANDHNNGTLKYNLYFNNCVDACQDAIQSNTQIVMPIVISPEPNSYFDSLIEKGTTRSNTINEKNNPGRLKPGEPKF